MAKLESKTTKRESRKARSVPPYETLELRETLRAFFDTPYADPVSGAPRAIGTFRWGVYLFYDYDSEPIYVGQTREGIAKRIGRHLTNQRTDAVAMSVLDPFEVCDIEVFPLSQFDGIEGKENISIAKAHLDALEFAIHKKAISESKFRAILNEKDPPPPKIEVDIPSSLRRCIVSDGVRRLRAHSDVRIARRAQIISRLAQTISERQVQNGLRRTMVTQSTRLLALADTRFTELGGKDTVEVGAESGDDENESA